jgi:hypothetical protein
MWKPIESAKKDGRLLFLLVAQHLDSEVSNNPTEDELVYRTIGHNNFEHDGEDVWQFAGWSWEYDRFVQGRGTPTHWQPMPEQIGFPSVLAGAIAVGGQLLVSSLITPGSVEGLPRIAVDGVFVQPGTLAAARDDDDQDGAA